MTYWEEKEKEVLNEMYPEGSRERQVLEFSRATPQSEEVPPMLYAAFRVLMGISILMAIVTLVAFLSH